MYIGVVIIVKEKMVIFYECIEVIFWELIEEEIDIYVVSKEFFDKVGSYGI